MLSDTAPKYTCRIDDSLGAKDRIFGSINAWSANAPTAATFSNVLNNNATGWTNGYEVSSGWTHVISPTFITELRFGINRWDQFAVNQSEGTNVQQVLGIGNSPRRCRRI